MSVSEVVPCPCCLQQFPRRGLRGHYVWCAAIIPVGYGVPNRKPCIECGRWLSLHSYYQNGFGLYGKDSMCKDCRRNLRGGWRYDTPPIYEEPVEPISNDETHTQRGTNATDMM